MYRGVHPRLNVKVDVKVFLVGGDVCSAAPSVVLDASHEAQTLALIDHPGVIRVFDVVESGESLALVTEYIEGRSLSERVLDELPAPNEWNVWFRALAEALQAVHSFGVLHRDVKPDNVLQRNRDGRMKLIDFGVAVDEACPGRRIAGTLHFMPPEVLMGDSAPTRSGDLYALGATMHEAWTGRGVFVDTPARIRSIGDLVKAKSSPRRMTPNRAGLPRSADELVHALLAPASADRPAVNDVLDALASMEFDVPTLGGARDELCLSRWIEDETLDSFGNWQVVRVRRAGSNVTAYAKVALHFPGVRFSVAAQGVLAAAKRVSAVEHANLVNVLDWGEHRGRPVIVVDTFGSTLAGRLATSGPLPVLEALRVAAQVADGVACLHQAGLVHQDLEPGVVQFDPRGYARVGGLEFVVPAGSRSDSTPDAPTAFKLPFAAPETLTGGPRQRSRDVYGIGGILLSALTGEPPGPNLTANDRVDRVLSASSCGEAVHRLVRELLAWDPRDRVESAAIAGERCRDLIRAHVR